MVTVPNVTPDTPALRKNPVFLYFEDGFQKPAPFRPDVAIPIDDVIDKKIEALDAHVSQMYEWLPWHDGTLDQVPKDPAARKAWLKKSRNREIPPSVREAVARWYGADVAKTVDPCRGVRSVRVRRAARRGDVEEAFSVRAEGPVSARQGERNIRLAALLALTNAPSARDLMRGWRPGSPAFSF